MNWRIQELSVDILKQTIAAAKAKRSEIFKDGRDARPQN